MRKTEEFPITCVVSSLRLLVQVLSFPRCSNILHYPPTIFNGIFYVKQGVQITL